MSTSLARRAANLEGSFAGRLITANDADYDAARAVFNSMIDLRPALIARCRTVADVVAAIRLARDSAVPIAVRGGGHSVAGMATCEGGVVIDLRDLNGVAVDAGSQLAVVGGGATIGDLDQATQPYGLATTGGRVSSTGIGGYTLGGGTGWLDRKFGLACDNVHSVDLVTADGTCVTASADEHRELFWALHGGGGNFGVAARITFRLHHLPAITAGVLTWRPDRAHDVLQHYREFMNSAADEVSGAAVFATGADAEFVPEDLRGQLLLLLVIVYVGGKRDASAAVAPLLTLGDEGRLLTQMNYTQLQSMFDTPPGARHYWSAQHLAALTDPAIGMLCDAATRMIVPSPSELDLIPGGGAAARQGLDDPIPWRTAPWVVHPFGAWNSPRDDERGCRWARDTRDAATPWSVGAVYLNFIGDEGETRVTAGYGATNYTRLAKVKATYDPDNLFRLNHNIKPAIVRA